MIDKLDKYDCTYMTANGSKLQTAAKTPFRATVAAILRGIPEFLTNLITQVVKATLFNNWIAPSDATYGDGVYYYLVPFTKDVIVYGAATGPHTNWNHVIFTLPVGYRPMYKRVFPVPTSLGFGSIVIGTNGDVQMGAGGNADVTVHFNGIRFRFEQ